MAAMHHTERRTSHSDSRIDGRFTVKHETCC